MLVHPRVAIPVRIGTYFVADGQACEKLSRWVPLNSREVSTEVGYDYVAEKGDFLMVNPGVEIPIDVKLHLMLDLSAWHPPLQPFLFPR